MIPLEPGERLLWQGRAEGRIPVDMSRPDEVVFGLAFIAFAVFWMDRAMRESDLMWLAGLPFLAIGLRLSVWRVWGPRLRARFSTYMLTDRRALVETGWPILRRKTRALVITPATMVDLDEGDPASLTLGNLVTGPRGATTESLSFTRISEARRVLALIRDIQKGAA
ncbi:MAG: hypothetical protein LBE86_01445 [Gemmobacter sp.]|jgi:hypothetical protein|nr:hypothetical protein [Gemmobacter sp.]